MNTSTSAKHQSARPAYRAGVLASILAETLFILLNSLLSAAQGNSPWMVWRLPAALLIGPGATKPANFEFSDVLLGLAMHLVMSGVVGLLYAHLVVRLPVSPLTLGLVVAGLLFLLGFWLLPALFPHWLAAFGLSRGGLVMEVITHLAYGVTFGLAYERLAPLNSMQTRRTQE